MNTASSDSARAMRQKSLTDKPWKLGVILAALFLVPILCLADHAPWIILLPVVGAFCWTLIAELWRPDNMGLHKLEVSERTMVASAEPALVE
jgi:hypothetical protein